MYSRGPEADDAGRYAVAAISSGIYEVKAAAESYMPSEIVVEIRENDGSVVRNIEMRRGLEITVHIVTPAGLPVANADGIEGVMSDGYNPEHMYSIDGTGSFTVRALPGERRTIFILPQEGSFVPVHRVAAASADDVRPIRVIVPPAVGSLRVKLVGSKRPLNLAMRYNGEDVPVSVWERFQRGTGWEFLQMPAGTYEVWPVEWPAGAPAGSAKTVGISAGPAEVQLSVDQGH